MLGLHSKNGHLTKTLGLGISLFSTALLLVYIHLKLHEYSFDDAYIHFRIVDHFIQNGVPYFNLTESVMTTSSSAWTLFLAGISVLGLLLGKITSISLQVALVNAGLTWLGALVFTNLLYRITHKAHSLFFYATFFVAYIALMLPASIGLMETPAAMLVVGIAFQLLLNNNPISFSILAGATFLRLELVIPLGLACVYAVASRNFKYRDLLVYTLFGAAPFIIFDLFYFRTIIPNTIKAKSVLYDLSYIDVIRNAIDAIVPYSQAQLLGLNYDFVILLSGLIISGLSIFAGSLYLLELSHLKSKKESDRTVAVGLLIVIWGGTLFGAYVAVRSLLFPWYVPLFLIPLAFAVSLAFAYCRSRLFKVSLFLLLLPILLVRMLGLVQASAGAFVNPSYFFDFGPGARVRHYIELGQELYSRYPNAVLMTSEIGGLGYGFKGYIYDAGGLASPQALSYHPLKVPEERSAKVFGAIPVRLVEDIKPDIIVSYDIFAGALPNSEVAKQYVRIRLPLFLEDDLTRWNQRLFWESRYLNLFIRKISSAGF